MDTLIYADLNVLDDLRTGKIKIRCEENCKFVYSNEHFREIRRSRNPDIYLSMLSNLNAKQLKFMYDGDFKPTGEYCIENTGTPFEKYDEYLGAISGFEGCDELVNPFLAWINGGAYLEQLRAIPTQFSRIIMGLTNVIDGLIDSNSVRITNCNFENTINQLVDQGNHIEATRKAFGLKKGQLNSISGENKIAKIWEIIKQNAPDISCDKFFGFDIQDLDMPEAAKLHFGIIGCCSVFDIIGYHAEKKIRELEKINNIRSDSVHLAMASVCTILLSKDTRLIKRAEAIYEYKNISCKPILI